MLGDEVRSKSLIWTGMLDLRYFATVLVAWMLSDEKRHVIARIHRPIPRQLQCRNQRAAANLPPGVYVRNTVKQQVSCSNFNLVPLVPQSFEVRITIYQFL